jgi:hypothetical protein
MAALGVALAVGPAHAGVAHHNPVGAPDATGDANGAADIVRVTMANDTRGRIVFIVQTANRAELVPGDLIYIRIDSDKNALTGEADRGAGIDYMIEIDSTARAVLLRRWSGTTFERAETTTLESVFDGGYAVLVNRSELGNTGAFRFYVLTALAGGNAAQVDTMPDAATHDYTLSISHVEEMTPRWTPALPRAGKTFRLSALQLTLQTGDRMAAARRTCGATLAGKRLRGTGPGRCTFRLPKSAKGKWLVVHVAAAPAGGEAETGRQVFRVR